MAELDQEFSQAAGREVIVTFTPHLVPMNRGILSTIYVRGMNEAPADRLHVEGARVWDRASSHAVEISELMKQAGELKTQLADAMAKLASLTLAQEELTRVKAELEAAQDQRQQQRGDYRELRGHRPPPGEA